MIYKTLMELHLRHERLKRYVHEGFRVPLPAWGRYIMTGIYFSIPIIGAFYLLDWNLKQAEKATGVNGELLPDKYKNKNSANDATTAEDGAVFGNTRLVDGKEQKVGPGGWGGGVRLTVSDAETEKRNEQKVRRYLRKLKREAQERQQQQEPQGER